MEAVRSTCHSQFCTAAAAVVVMILVIVVVVMVMLAVIVVVMVMVTVTVMVAVTDYHDLWLTDRSLLYITCAVDTVALNWIVSLIDSTFPD